MAPAQKRVTVNFDADLHRALRLKAVETDRSLSAIVNEAVKLTLAGDAEDLAAFDERAAEPNLPFAAGMELLRKIRHLWDHLFWADAKLIHSLRPGATAVPEAVREYAHIIGTEEVWLARLQHRPARAAVWPTVSFDELERLIEHTHARYKMYLAELQDTGAETRVTYTNSAGQTFTNAAADILLHVALHGQYHRGKVNLLLRQAGCDPVATDYIAFVRGAPAATVATTRRGPG